jgi:uncharacterized protein
MKWLCRLFKSRNKRLEIEKLRRFSASRWPEDLGTTHGVEHWDRVAFFGMMLYQEGADSDVIQAFAYLHDSERMNNEDDINHGKRASELIDLIRRTELRGMSNEQIAKLKRACELHTIERKTGDLTIDICFDADRMDLLRVGIMPKPERMATQRGAELISDPDYETFYTHEVLLCTKD